MMQSRNPRNSLFFNKKIILSGKKYKIPNISTKNHKLDSFQKSNTEGGKKKKSTTKGSDDE